MPSFVNSDRLLLRKWDHRAPKSHLMVPHTFPSCTGNSKSDFFWYNNNYQLSNCIIQYTFKYKFPKSCFIFVCFYCPPCLNGTTRCGIKVKIFTPFAVTGISFHYLRQLSVENGAISEEAHFSLSSILIEVSSRFAFFSLWSWYFIFLP